MSDEQLFYDSVAREHVELPEGWRRVGDRPAAGELVHEPSGCRVRLTGASGRWRPVAPRSRFIEGAGDELCGLAGTGYYGSARAAIEKLEERGLT